MEGWEVAAGGSRHGGGPAELTREAWTSVFSGSKHAQFPSAKQVRADDLVRMYQAPCYIPGTQRSIWQGVREH